MRVFATIAATVAVLFGVAHAAAVTVANNDFEDPYSLENGGNQGLWAYGASGWEGEGTAGTWEYPDSLFPNAPASTGDRIAFVNAGGSLSQDLGVVVESGVDYTLSALFGHRGNKNDFAGSFGFYIGDPADALFIGLTAITDPGLGLFASQSVTVTAAMLQDYIGQQLGIVFIGEDGQVNFDNVQVMAYGDVLEQPLPGAVWLFASALVAGGIAKRRKKKA